MKGDVGVRGRTYQHLGGWTDLKDLEVDDDALLVVVRSGDGPKELGVVFEEVLDVGHLATDHKDAELLFGGEDQVLEREVERVGERFVLELEDAEDLVVAGDEESVVGDLNLVNRILKLENIKKSKCRNFFYWFINK